MERSEAVVVGAGATGSAAAYALALRGVSTVLLEQFLLGHRKGSSHGSTRVFRLSHPDRDYVELARRALRSWRELEVAADEQMLVPTGGIDVGAHVHDCADALEKCKIDHELLSPSAAAERFPMISFEGFDSVLYQVDSAVCLAERALAAMLRLARGAGVDVREHTVVQSLGVGDKVVVETQAGSIKADVVIVTAGAWITRLLANTIELPLRPTLTQVSYFETRESRGLPEPLVFIETGDLPRAWYGYMVPGGIDANEVKVGLFEGGVPVDPGAGPFPVDAAAEQATSEYVRRRLPQLEPAPTRSETCLYTMAPDEDFVLDRVGPVVIGAACSGHGFKFAPLLGTLLANLALDRDTGIPRDRFSAARFYAERSAG